jgi:Flp pilus assembly protein TadG
MMKKSGAMRHKRLQANAAQPACALNDRGVSLRQSAVTALSRFWRNEEGAALVEMALSLPLMLMLTLAMLSFGITMNNYLQLNEATSSGARYLSESAGVAADPCATTIAAITTSAPALNASNLKYTFSFNTGSSTYNYNGGNTLSCTAASAYLVPSQWVSVTATYPCNLAVYGVNYAPNCVLTATMAEVVQ